MPQIVLPYRYTPRSYQLPVLRALDGGATRVVAVWHRRSGKEKTFVAYMPKRMVHRVGTYFYFFPTYGQAKKAVWDGIDGSGMRFLEHFPDELVAKKTEDDMKIELRNGSIFQLVGTDNIDRIMSTNPVGCVFAEYALQDPSAWEYVRPILRENGGWAIFDYTPRGKNHGYDLYQTALKLQSEGDKSWFVQRLTVDDTGALSAEDIEAERREGMSEDMIRQEYYCSFEGVQQGSIFGRPLEEAEADGRVCGVPWEPELPVSTWWDIGTGDATAIWFTQDAGREVHVIDYYENSGVGVDHYVKHLQGMRYTWGVHHGPHDLNNASFAANGRSTKQTAKALGFEFDVVKKLPKQDQINAGRAFFPRCWFDRRKTERGRMALMSYHYTWDERRKVFSAAPYHDWSSNGADAWQILGVGHKFAARRQERVEPRRFMEISARPDNSWLGA